MEQQVPSRFVEIGRIGKARGLDGTVRFIPGQRFFIDGLLVEAAILYIRNERADLVPLRIEKVHKEEKRNHQSFFVKFDLIASREQADSARDKAVYADKNNTNPILTDEPETDFFGYKIIYQNRLVGEVLDVMESPAHPILQVKIESEPGVILIPFVNEFVESVDHQNQQLFCKELDQLTDL